MSSPRLARARPLLLSNWEQNVSLTLRGNGWRIFGRSDAVLNLVGGDTVVPSYALVKPGGVAVTANRPPIAEEAARLGIEAAFVETNVTTEGLNAFATLVTDGKIKPQIAAVETLWSPTSLWEKRETDKIGKIVFSIRS
jgi:NADPH:quinone reductase-like Zn-dependent oxidoreductase